MDVEDENYFPNQLHSEDLNSKMWEAWNAYLNLNSKNSLLNFMEKLLKVFPEFCCQSYTLINSVNGGGPHLDELPSDILSTLERFLKETCQNKLGDDDLYSIELGLKTLCLICRNFDNIPFIASCDFISNIIGLLSFLIHKLPNENQDNYFSIIHLGLYFLECIYDPYFNWRNVAVRGELHGRSNHFSPAFLHIEVVPFIYDCFQIKFENVPYLFSLFKHYLQLFGAILSGAKHNSLRACCPAMMETLWKCISDINLDITVREVAVDCLGCFLMVVSKYRPDQIQVDIIVVIREFSDRWLNLCQIENIENNYLIANKCLEQLQSWLIFSRKAQLQALDWLLVLIKVFKISTDHSNNELFNNLRTMIIQNVCSILQSNKEAMAKMIEIKGFDILLESFKEKIILTESLLTPFLLVVVRCHSNGLSKEVLHPEVAKFVIQCFPLVKSEVFLEQLTKLLNAFDNDIHTKMLYSEAGVLVSVIKAWGFVDDFKSACVLANLVEIIGCYSITPNELLNLLKLMRLDKDGNQFKYSRLVMRSLSLMAKRESLDEASYFFDFQEPFHGIEIPVIDKWPGYSFSFCTWIRLDNISDSLSSVPVYRRQLYSFVTSSDCGYEAFFLPDGILVIAVLVKKEYITVTLPDQIVNDNKWHFISICHYGSRRPFVQGQLLVYVDGKLKLTTSLKSLSLSDPFVSCRIGSGRQKISSGKFTSASTATGRLFSNLQLPSFLSLPMPLKATGLVEGTTVIDTGRQDQIWGVPSSLQGQLSSVAIFFDVLQPLHVKCMHAAGPNHLTLFATDDGDLAELSSKLMLLIHAKAYDNGVCYDLSPFKLFNGQVNGHHCATWKIKDSLNCIGGVSALLPILENCKLSYDIDNYQPEESNLMKRENSLDDWVVLPSPSFSDWKIEQNEAAGFFILLKNFILYASKNAELNAGDVATAGALLNNIPYDLIDVHLLMAVQLFLESVNGKENYCSLKHAIFQHLLFDFKIWSKCNFAVQIGHIQFLSTIIKDDRKYFRKRYGIQFLLDVIRQFYSCQASNLCPEDSKAIRGSLFALIRYFIFKEINNKEMTAILGFLLSVKEETMLTEIIDSVLLSVMEHQQCKDQIFLLIYEPGCVELFYCLLLNPLYSIHFRCLVLKLIGTILGTTKVYDKNKVRLRLQDIGFAGLLSRLEGMPLSNEMAKYLVEQILLTDNVASWHGLLVLLYFIRFTDASLKLQVVRKVAQSVLLHSTSLHLIALQQGWHDCILELMIKQPVSNFNSEEKFNDKSIVSPLLPGVPPSFINISGSPISIASLTPKIVDEFQLSSSPKVKLQPFVRNTFDFDVQSLEESKSFTNSKTSSLEDLSASQSSDIVKSIDDVEGSIIVNNVGFEVETQINELKLVAESLKLDSLTVDNFEDFEDELCQLVSNIVYLILWRGIPGTDKRSWRERGQVFTCINILALSNHLYRSHLEIKRRILELMLNAAVFDLKEAGQANAMYTENALVIMRWAFDFIVVDSSQDHCKKLSGKLFDGILALLDTLMVLEDSSDDWTEMTMMGIRILLEFASSENLEFCSMATPKLHTLIQTRLTWSKVGEVFFFLEHLDTILIKTVEMQDQDHYSFIIPLIKALLETAGPRLHLDHHLPNLPTNLSGPSLFEEFQHYCQSTEWRTFISKQVRPVALRHSMLINDAFVQAMNEFWNDCYEDTMISIHKRNREWGESRLRFQALIMDPFSTKCIEDQTRYNNVVSQSRNQNLIIRRRWRLKKLYLQGLRGPWQRRKEYQFYWKLSHRENLSRMRLKMILNHNFDIHAEASRLRDNLASRRLRRSGGMPGPCQPESIPLAVALEARNTQQQIDDTVNEEDMKVFLASETQELELSGKEKLILTEECEFVFLMSIVKGRLELTTTHIYFFDISPVKEDAERYDFKFSLDLLEELHLRRYNLRRSALEFFLIDQTTYFLNFNAKIRNKVFTRILSLRPPNLTVYSNGSPADVLRTSSFTQKWINNEISNFDYLMILNTIAGRTFNDLSQYPVFPWILTDYESSELDLNNPLIFRDLSKPLGIVNEKNISIVKAKYEQFEDPSGFVEKFHYGTHYSNSAGVLQYLVRVEPFTTLHIELQSNRFDVADRQFHSILGTWKMLMENSNDVKELIPEFFYLPEFLLNLNGFDLGMLQGNKGKHIGDVILPNWASDPYDFIFKHRKALESDYVSSHLHEWIDLIFGFKQKGPHAVEALNVFYYCSYEGAVNLDSITDPITRTAMEGMINNFGQTPCQLLKDPHPVRLSKQEVIQRFSKSDNKGLSLFLCLDNLRFFEVEITTDDPVVFVAPPQSVSRLGSSSISSEPLITITRSGVIGINNWLPFNKSISSFFTLDIDPTISNSRNCRKFSVAFQPGFNVNSNLFAVSSTSKLLYSAGHWDNSIRVLKFSKGKIAMRLVGHKDIVTCLALDRLGRNLISGSKDLTCIIWDVSRLVYSSAKDLQVKLLHTLCGHEKEIVCVSLMTELDMAVSGSKDGTVNVHTMREGLYLRTLRPYSPTIDYEISHLALTSQGQFVIVTFRPKEIKQNKYALHLYSTNGHHIWEETTNCVTSLVMSEDYVITGNSRGQIGIHELHQLKLLKTLSLPSPISHISITNRNTHIIASLNNGHIMVICVALPVDFK